MKLFRILLAAIILLAAGVATAQPEGPSRYDTVQFAIESTGEFSEVDGTLKIIDADSNKVQLSVVVIESEPPEVVAELQKSAIVLALIVSFAHTDATSVTVTAMPEVLDVKTKDTHPAKDQALTLAVTREKFEKALLEKLDVKSAKELVGTRLIQGEIMKDQLMGVTGRILYEDQGEPGLERFYSALY